MGADIWSTVTQTTADTASRSTTAQCPDSLSSVLINFLNQLFSMNSALDPVVETPTFDQDHLGSRCALP